MKRRNILSLSALATLGLPLLPASVFAEQNSFEKQLVGTWTQASSTNKNASGAQNQPFGPHPIGAYIFDPSGHVIQVIVPGEEGTAKAIVATFGTYSVTDGGKTLVIHYIGSNQPKLDGTDSKRGIVSLANDEIKLHNPNTVSAGGGTADTVWNRAK